MLLKSQQENSLFNTIILLLLLLIAEYNIQPDRKQMKVKDVVKVFLVYFKTGYWRFWIILSVTEFTHVMVNEQQGKLKNYEFIYLQ